MQNFLSSRTAVISCCIISGLLCVAGSALFYRKLNEQKAAYQDMLMNTADSLYLTMREIQRLSYMLMLNTEVQTFVTQGAIAQGSADIQTIINAQRQLSYIKSVHPEIAGLYIYSKKSGYLLEADNAFFDINFMYPSLLEFEGLNSSQWRERYLRPIYTNAWLPECTGISKGNRQLLLVFAQTFPLQNTAANTGKLLILLHSSYFKNQLRLLAPSNEAAVQLADERSGILLSYCGNGASTAASLQTAYSRLCRLLRYQRITKRKRIILRSLRLSDVSKGAIILFLCSRCGIPVPLSSLPFRRQCCICAL